MSYNFWLALGWSVLGFTVGFTACWLWTSSVREAARSAIESGDVSVIDESRTVSGRTVIGVLILLLLVISSIRYYQRTDCQTRYNEAVSISLSETSEARGKETIAEANKAEAQAAWLRSLIELQGRDPQRGLEITNEYLRTLDEHVASLKELERVRALHPVPAPANCR